MIDDHKQGRTGKSVFHSMAVAKAHAKKMRRRYHEPLHAYRCNVCKQIHIGGE